VRSVAIQSLTRFVTTRWNLIHAKQTLSEDSGHAASAELCQIYWRPILAFILRQGYSLPDAQDLTQDFFIDIFDGKLLRSADPNRGRFRSLLLKSLKNFLTDRRVGSRRCKRGGRTQFVPWSDQLDDVSDYTMLASGLATYPDETLFDVRWAATVAKQALHRLQEECESKGHRRFFEVLRDYLVVDRSEVSYRHLSVLLGVAEGSVKRLIHRFRARYRALIRDEVAKTVKSPDDIDAEVRYLCSLLSGRTFPSSNGST
jgi:DNA-directed RNA polymerase specialized sigma24 family protein